MLAGDQNRRTLDRSDSAQDAVQYVCLNETITVPQGHGMLLPSAFPLVPHLSRFLDL